MQITFDRAALETALRALSRITTRNRAATDDVFMEAAADGTVRLTTTDAQTWLATTLAAETDGTGVLLVPAELLLNYIRGLGVERITLDADTAGHTALVWKSNHLRLLCRDPEQFPRPPALAPDAPAFTLPAALLQTLGRWCLPVAQDVGGRPILGTVHADQDEGHLRFTGTDGMRLSRVQVPFPGTVPAVSLPTRLLKQCLALAKTDPVTIRRQDNRIQASLGSWTITSLLVEGKFPDADRVIPSSYVTTITCDAAELQAAIDRLTIVIRSQRGGQVMTLAIQDGQLVLRAENLDTGTVEEIVDAVIDGPAWSLHFQPGFLLDALKMTGADGDVSLAISGAQSPLRVTHPRLPEALHIVLPLRDVVATPPVAASA
jgi:DNA polymerase-3 subunit beta